MIFWAVMLIGSLVLLVGLSVVVSAWAGYLADKREREVITRYLGRRK